MTAEQSTVRPGRVGHVGGFHEGELEVQERAGVAEEAARLEGMLAPAQLGGGAAIFLSQQRFAVLGARDEDGRLWASPLTGRPGFLEAAPSELTVKARPSEEDPLRAFTAGQSGAVIAMDLMR